MIKILFVDDKSNLLDGLKRMLRKMRNEWGMAFVLSGQEALDLLKKDEYRVIVTDNKMPGMDGLELLRQVKDKYKDIKRIILTGQSESEVFNKAKEIAHANVSKPCNPDELISIIEKIIDPAHDTDRNGSIAEKEPKD